MLNAIETQILNYAGYANTPADPDGNTFDAVRHALEVVAASLGITIDYTKINAALEADKGNN